jgi:hypothetical protein
MNIIIGEEAANSLGEKYLVLELDRLLLPGLSDPTQSYAVLEITSIQDIGRIKELQDLHHNLITYYRQKNWKFCEDCLEHLQGAWSGQLDSFYDHLKNRVSKAKDSPDDWSDIIVKSQ